MGFQLPMGTLFWDKTLLDFFWGISLISEGKMNFEVHYPERIQAFLRVQNSYDIRNITSCGYW